MNWETDQYFVHSATSNSNVESDIKQAVLDASEYAFELLKTNIEDDSMFCLFDWNFDKQVLTVMVTDPSKTKLSKHKVVCFLTGYAGHIADKEDQHEQIRLWVHNYITTAATFLQYSLVAAITADGEPSSSILL